MDCLFWKKVNFSDNQARDNSPPANALVLKASDSRVKKKYDSHYLGVKNDIKAFENGEGLTDSMLDQFISSPKLKCSGVLLLDTAVVFFIENMEFKDLESNLKHFHLKEYRLIACFVKNNEKTSLSLLVFDLGESRIYYYGISSVDSVVQKLTDRFSLLLDVNFKLISNFYQPKCEIEVLEILEQLIEHFKLKSSLKSFEPAVHIAGEYKAHLINLLKKESDNLLSVCNVTGKLSSKNELCVGDQEDKDRETRIRLFDKCKDDHNEFGFEVKSRKKAEKFVKTA